MNDFFGLDGKTVCVVGAGQGIGEATALAFAQAGANVALIDRDLERAEAVAAQVEAIGQRSTIVIGDVLDGDPGQLIAQAAEAAGGLHVLVTIVGMSGFRALLDTSLEEWDAEHRVNLRYIVPAARAFVRHRIDAGGGGALTFISSVGGVTAAPYYAAYGSFKAGLIHLAKSMAAEWAPHDIRVNTVAPGSIITPRLPDNEDWQRMINRSAVPIKRRGVPREIAEAALFLSSDMASFVTGQTLAVDGGLTAANVVNVPADPTV